VGWRWEVEKFRKQRKKMSRRLSKALSLFLGILMFMFGFLKFFQPFRGWFDIQIQQSHLPHEAIPAGKLMEMVTGSLFLLPWLRRSLTAKSRDQILLVACLILVAQMGTAIYVHLQPQVPANVLPLGIKAPVIPVVVLLLGLLTAFAVWKERRAEKASDVPTE
jgi:uncharacterized membrane protein YfcA